MSFATLSFAHFMLVMLVAVMVLLSLIRANKALVEQRLRFYGIAALNVMMMMLLTAWLFGLQVERVGQTVVSIDSELMQQRQQQPSSVSLSHPSLQRVTVDGFGFYQPQLAELLAVNPHIDIDFNSASLDAGLINVAWPQQLLLGQLARFDADWHDSQSPERIVTVELSDMAGTLVASRRVKHQESFNIEFRPKLAGKIHYLLTVLDEQRQVLAEERLMLSVNRAAALKLLVVQSSPSFETRHLKHWAASQGAQMLILTQISRDRYVTQAVNRDKALDHQLNQMLLANNDVLLIDGRSLVELDSERQHMIAEAVKQGLGMVVLADSDLAGDEQQSLRQLLFAELELMPSDDVNTQTVLPMIAGEQSEVAFELPRLQLVPVGVNEVMQRDMQGRVLTVKQHLGDGVVAVSIINQRYQWRLYGQIDKFTQSWRDIFNQVSRVSSQPRFVVDANDKALALLQQRQQLCVLSDEPELQLFSQDKVWPLRQDQHQLNRYCIWYWPWQAGWQQWLLVDAKGKLIDNLWQYHYNPQTWQRHQQHQRLVQTQQFVATNKPLAGEAVKVKQRLDDWIYWLLLVLGSSLLWWESRLRSLAKV